MKETLKTSLRAVALLLYLFVAILASAGAFSTGDAVYIIGGICNLVAAFIQIYMIIRRV